MQYQRFAFRGVPGGPPPYAVRLIPIRVMHSGVRSVKHRAKVTGAREDLAGLSHCLPVTKGHHTQLVIAGYQPPAPLSFRIFLSGFGRNTITLIVSGRHEL